MTTILTMIDRHTELHRELDRLYALGGDDAAESSGYRALAREAMALEHAVIAKRATTAAERAAKAAFIEALDDGTIDLRRLIGAILELDAAVIAEAA